MKVKVTSTKFKAVMADVKAGGMTAKQLAAKHKLGMVSILNIKRAKTYKAYQAHLEQRRNTRKAGKTAVTKDNGTFKVPATTEKKLAKGLKTIEVKQDVTVSQELLEEFDEKLRVIRLAQEDATNKQDQILDLLELLGDRLSVIYRLLPKRWRKKAGK